MPASARVFQKANQHRSLSRREKTVILGGEKGPKILVGLPFSPPPEPKRGLRHTHLSRRFEPPEGMTLLSNI